MVVHGLALDGRFAAGDVVIVSSLEHNAVMRPLAQLRETLGIKIEICPVGPNFKMNLQALVEKHEPKLVALVWASNVTGEVLPIEEIAVYLNERKIPLLVDGAQVAGKLKIDLSANPGISFFCTSGHKGLMGPPGVGLLYVAPQYTLAPFLSGGTGSRSESLEMPTAYPDRLEAGTLPGPAIAGLSAGVDWIKAKNTKAILQNELALLEKFLQWNSKEKLVRVFDTGLSSQLRMPLVSFKSDNLSAAEMADQLDTEYGIAVRSGLHCSASSHETLGTLDQGLVRVSFGPFNTEEEVNRLCDALVEVTKK